MLCLHVCVLHVFLPWYTNTNNFHAYLFYNPLLKLWASCRTGFHCSTYVPGSWEGKDLETHTNTQYAYIHICTSACTDIPTKTQTHICIYTYITKALFIQSIKLHYPIVVLNFLLLFTSSLSFFSFSIIMVRSGCSITTNNLKYISQKLQHKLWLYLPLLPSTTYNTCHHLDAI